MDTLVVDVETKYSFAEVGGREHIGKLGVSVAGIYSYAENNFWALEEKELPKLEDMLQKTKRLIGFNIKYFDIPVLAPFLSPNVFSGIQVTDLYEDAVNFLGHRVGLDLLCKATLGEGKSGHGLEALQWFREGRVEEVKKYCLDDVRLTRDLYEYGKKHKHVLFESNLDPKIRSIPVPWGEEETEVPIAKLLEEAFLNKERLAIQYVSSQDSDGMGFAKSRLIDIYKIQNDKIEAYCHLRKDVRNFRIARIIKAEKTSQKYIIPQEAQQSLL